MSDQGGLTARGQAVAAGLNALAVDGDDTLTVPAGAPDQGEARGDSPDLDPEETSTGGETGAESPDAPAAHSPSAETTVDVVADDRETRA